MVLFDEPLSSLDPSLRKHLRTEIRSQQKRFGLTAIYVTHDLEEAMAMADKVAVMDNGSIRQCSTPKELWSNPANDAVARFLGNGPCLPVLHFEGLGKEVVAVTATGRFPLHSETTRLLRSGGSWGQRSKATSNIQIPETPLAALSPTMSFAMPEPFSDILSTIPEVYIFFERTQALPFPSGQSGQPEVKNGDGFFSAICMGTDFAGDAVDCVMKGGQTSFSLRLPPEIAPEPGDHIQFSVRSEKVRVIPIG